MLTPLALAPLFFDHHGYVSVHLHPGRCHWSLSSAPQSRDRLMPYSPVSGSIVSPCDLTAAEWAPLVPLVPALARRGRPRAWPLRLLVKARFDVLRTGCAWRDLPRESPLWQTTYTTFRQWRLHGVWPRVHEA